jgi:hypothetical protein
MEDEKTVPLNIKISEIMDQELAKTVGIMRRHFAGARFSKSDVVRLCLEAHMARLREMYR